MTKMFKSERGLNQTKFCSDYCKCKYVIMEYFFRYEFSIETYEKLFRRRPKLGAGKKIKMSNVGFRLI